MNRTPTLEIASLAFGKLAITERTDAARCIVPTGGFLGNNHDGFVITAFLTRRKKQLERRRRIWQR